MWIFSTLICGKSFAYEIYGSKKLWNSKFPQNYQIPDSGIYRIWYFPTPHTLGSAPGDPEVMGSEVAGPEVVILFKFKIANLIILYSSSNRQMYHVCT